MPENILGVPFQPPFTGLPAIVDKEHGQHLRVGHNAQKFSVVAKFHEVIGGGGCRTGQAEWGGAEEVDNLVAYFTGEGF